MPQFKRTTLAVPLALLISTGSAALQAAPADSRKPAAPAAKPAPAKPAAAGIAPKNARPAKPAAAAPVKTAIRRSPIAPQAPAPAGALPNYQNRDAVRLFAKEIAARHQLEEAQVLNTLQQARYQPAVAKAIVPPSQPGARNWTKYRNNHVDSMRLKAGLKFWELHENTLRLAEERYGVPPEIIVAIIGIETIFGRHSGNFRTIDALSTLAFDYPPATRNRSEFFRGELESFFVLAREAGLNPLEVRGSFAGAIGMGQFMPSSWRRFAVDGNGDGEIDLFHSSADTIASVGNFLRTHGWQRNAFWFSHATVADEGDSRSFASQMVADGIIPRLTRQQLQEKGIAAAPSDLGEMPGEADLLSLIDLPTGLEKMEYRLGGRNFYAVTRYNRSNFYGMSVMELAQNLRLGWDERRLVRADAGKPVTDPAEGSKPVAPKADNSKPASIQNPEPIAAPVGAPLTAPGATPVLSSPPAQLPQVNPLTPVTPAASSGPGKQRT